MSEVAEVLELARRHGVEVEARGEILHLRADAEPPPEVVDALMEHPRLKGTPASDGRCGQDSSNYGSAQITSCPLMTQSGHKVNGHFERPHLLSIIRNKEPPLVGSDVSPIEITYETRDGAAHWTTRGLPLPPGNWRLLSIAVSRTDTSNVELRTHYFIRHTKNLVTGLSPFCFL